MTMLRPAHWFAFPLPVFLSACLHLADAPSAQAQYQVGNIVSTNFGLVNRYLWTNDNGQVFTAGNSLIRLSDFNGKIVFYVLYDTW